MKGKFILAIDQGTTSTRCIIFDRNGESIGSNQIAHKQIYPAAGLVEHDPMEILSHTIDAMKNAVNDAKISPSDIASIGITNQRETTVLWNRETGIPYYNAIVWQDIRTGEICDEICKEFGEERITEKTGLPVSTYFSASKLKWLLRNINIKNDIKQGKAMFGTIDTWLLWWLTGGPQGGVFATDVTNASRTMLMNINTLDWDEDILKYLGIDKIILPEIKPSISDDSFGLLKVEGLKKFKIPITGVLGDQQAALLGQSCFEKGEVKNTYGTGCFLLLNTGEIPVRSRHGLITTVAYQFKNKPPFYALEGSVAIAGALIQWLKENLGIIKDINEIEHLARSVEDNSGIYFVPAFSGLFAPYWDKNARGIITGLTRYSNRAHIARAALEATAYQTRDILNAMERDSLITPPSLKVDGGMINNEFLMQFQADILGIEILRPRICETTSLGAAYAAGLAVHFWKSLKELRDNWKIDKVFRPQLSEKVREKLYDGWLEAVNKSFSRQ